MARRYPVDIAARIDELIRLKAQAKKGAEATYALEGLPNKVIVQACLTEARTILPS